MQARILDNGRLLVTNDPQQIHEAFECRQPLWVELEQQDHACDVLLAQQLKLHSLTIEDIWATRSHPKLESYDDYLYIRIHGIAGTMAGEIQLVELDLVLGPTYVITHDPRGFVSVVQDELERSPRLLEKGPAWLAHAILDAAVDRYLPVIDELDSQIEVLENDVLRKAGTRQGPPILRKILGFKRLLLALRRVSIHQREILLQLSRGEFEEIPREATPFYRDVYDHFLRVNDLVESYRDIVSGALDAYLSVQSNRMNDIMKTLTLMSTVLLPITFIAGVYGMNFEYMPELKSRWGYPLALGSMACVVIFALLWFRRRGWIGSADLDLPADPAPALKPASSGESPDDGRSLP